jgi:hypothetical protein
MASVTLPREVQGSGSIPNQISMPEAAKLLSREERFMGTVAAMNTLLIAKGVYSQQEFDAIFVRWASAQFNKPKKVRPGWRTKIAQLLGL